MIEAGYDEIVHINQHHAGLGAGSGRGTPATLLRLTALQTPAGARSGQPGRVEATISTMAERGHRHRTRRSPSMSGSCSRAMARWTGVRSIMSGTICRQRPARCAQRHVRRSITRKKTSPIAAHSTRSSPLLTMMRRARHRHGAGYHSGRFPSPITASCSWYQLIGMEPAEITR